MIINTIALLLTILGLLSMTRQQHAWYMYPLGLIIGFFAWKAAISTIIWPFKFIINLF